MLPTPKQVQAAVRAQGRAHHEGVVDLSSGARRRAALGSASDPPTAAQPARGRNLRILAPMIPARLNPLAVLTTRAPKPLPRDIALNQTSPLVRRPRLFPPLLAPATRKQSTKLPSMLGARRDIVRILVLGAFTLACPTGTRAQGGGGSGGGGTGGGTVYFMDHANDTNSIWSMNSDEQRDEIAVVRLLHLSEQSAAQRPPLVPYRSADCGLLLWRRDDAQDGGLRLSGRLRRCSQ